jgi:O-antigen ligase
MSETSLLVLRLGVLLLIFLVCLHLERRRRGVVVVLLMLSVALLDAALYPDTNANTLRSIFHPTLFGQSFRLTQLAIPLAVVARLVVHGRPRRFDASAPFWVAFFAWTAASTVIGLLAGHDSQLVFGEATIIVHVGGMIFLAAGVPARDYVNDRAVRRFLQGCAVVATVLFALDVAEVRIESAVVPDLPVVRFGSLGADATTLFSSLGVLALVLGLTRPKHLGSRAALLVPAALLILSHLASTQRAARLGLYVTLLVVLVIACLPTSRRRLGFSAGQVGFAAAGVAALGFAAVFVPAVASVAAPQSAVATADASGFAPTSRQGSIESRFNQWNVVLEKIQDRPLTGEGLGGRFVSYSAGLKTFVQGDISHNIVLDLLRRTGVVGLALAAAAVLAVWTQAAGTWRFHPSTQIAGLAAGAATVTAGLLAKGMVESIFEKHRLAVLLGLVIGMTISASMSWLRPGPLSADAAERRRRRQLTAGSA